MRRLYVAFLVILTLSCDGAEENLVPCGNVCSEGDSICNPDGELVLCQGPDENGCFEWGEAQTCGVHQECSEGACICDVQCEIGDEMCGPNLGRMSCRGPDEEGCFYWGEEQPCEPEPCPDLCGCETGCIPGETICGEEGRVRSCEGPDEYGCYDWSEEQDCGEYLRCVPEVDGCMPDTPVECYRRNTCVYEGQVACEDDTRYWECIADKDGCLRFRGLE